MAESKQVIFTFNEHSYESLKQIQSVGRFSTLAEAIQQSLVISKALQSQGKQGFTEVIVRNPETGCERVLALPRTQD
jgi:hypothetical protein